MESLTPVSLLQEYLVKEGVLPVYKLIWNSVGQDPLFKYEVSAKGISVTGKGRSKKEAKHEAAKMLLLQLKGETIWREEIHIISPYANDIKENAVGALQEFCMKNQIYGLPKFEVIKDEGDGYGKIFGVRCTVLSYSTEAEARNKKQAKQLASHLMLLELQKVHEKQIGVSDGDKKVEMNFTMKTCNNKKETSMENYEEKSTVIMTEKPLVSSLPISSVIDGVRNDNFPSSKTLQAWDRCDSTVFESEQNPENLSKAKIPSTELELKTYVSLLQEYLIKDGVIPTYKLILNGSGTHDPIFQWEVSANGVSMIGEGRSKKEAKQEAAKMLFQRLKGKTIQNEDAYIVSSNKPLQENSSVKENAVGALQEFCIKHKIQSPIFEVIKDEYKTHAKIFGIRCTVLSYKTEAEACNKKQAKQQAANMMLLKLNNAPLEEITAPLDIEKEELSMTVKACNATMEAYEKELQKRMMNDKSLVSSLSIGTIMGDYSNHISKNVLPYSETLKALIHYDDMFFEYHQNPEAIFKAIMEQLNYNYKFGSLDSKSKHDFLCYLYMKDLYNANFIGVAKNSSDARRNAIVKALKFMVTMSKV